MSNPMENKSLVNFTEEFRVRGWEIQSYVEEEEMVVDYGSPVLHNELARILRRMVSESLSEMKPPEQKIEILNSYEIVTAGDAKHNLGSRNRGRPAKSTLIKELAISFELPNYCIAKKLDMDKVALSYRNSSVPHGKVKLISAPQFSFKERLEDWNIQCRQRLTNISDTFYRHTKAKRSFRSIVEVVRFMLYETHPNSRKENKGIPADIQDKHMIVADASPTISSKTKPAFRGGDKEEQEEMSYKMMVKKFFKDSYRNFINFDEEDTDNEEENKVWEPEYFQEISSGEERKNQEGLESETVEDMLETMYDGLRKISTEKKRIMNKEEKQRNGVKKPRIKKGSDNIQSPHCYATVGKEAKQEVQDRELDELTAAEVLLNLKSARSELKHYIPVSKSLHQLAQLLLKIEGRAYRCRCRCRCSSIQISK